MRRRQLLPVAGLIAGMLAVLPATAADPADPTDQAPATDPAPAAGRYVEADRWQTTGAPSAITFADGAVAVTMGTYDKVSRFKPSGRLINSFDIDFSYPYGIAGDSAGRLHITEYSGFDSTTQIHVYRKDGSWVREYGVPDGASSLFSPWGLTVEPSGMTWVANATGDDIQRIMPNGSWGGRLGGPGGGNGEFDRPVDVTVAGGHLYVVDSSNSRVQRFRASDGEFVNAWGQEGLDPGQFENPLGVEVTPDGRVLVLDRSGASDAVLNEFTPSGRFLGRTTLPLSQARGLAVDRQGNVYVAGLIAYPKGGWGVLKLRRSAPSVARPAGKALDADKRRRSAPLRITCSRGSTQCAGSVRVRANGALVGQGSYRVASGRAGVVQITLTKKARTLLKRKANVPVRVKLAAKQGRGGSKRMTLTR